jgi:hypothetical protein
MPRLAALFCLLLSCGVSLRAATAPGPESAASIPREGLVLWLTAHDAVVERGTITAIRDRSGLGNDAVRQSDPRIVAGNPVVVTHEEARQPVLRFSGAFVGFDFKALTNIRTVFFVVSKHPAAFKQFAERFVLGGRAKAEVDFHVGAHWTDTIIELGMFKHGKVWFNGLPCDPALSEFAPKLAVISFAAGRDCTAAQLARDRDFIDRSWYGDIAEIILYRTPLTDADRQAVENHLMRKYSITPFPPVTVARESVLPGHTKPPPGTIPPDKVL